MPRLLRFYKPNDDLDTLPVDALSLSSPERKLYQNEVAADPRHICQISVFNLESATANESRESYNCVRGSETPKSSWSVSFSDIEATLSEKLPAEVWEEAREWVRWEFEAIDNESPCNELPGSQAHCGLYGMAAHKKNDPFIKQWTTVIRTYVARLFVREHHTPG